MELTKRRLLYGLGATAGGIGFTITQADDAAAELTMTGLSIPDKSAEITGDVSALVLAVTYDWDYDGNAHIDEALFQLQVGETTDSVAPITGIKLTDTGKTNGGTNTLQGDILSHSDYTAEMFSPPEQETTSEDVRVHLRMALKKAGEVVHEKVVKAHPVISVTNNEITITSQLQGSGGVTVQNGAG